MALLNMKGILFVNSVLLGVIKPVASNGATG